MLNFNFYSPTRFIFGRGVENQAGEQVLAQGAKKALVVYGGGSAVKSGLLARVTASLEEKGVAYVTLGGVQPNPRASLVRKGIETCRSEGADFLLAVGGGSVIDTCKAIAMGVPYEGDFWDFFCGKAKPKSALGVGVVLTIAAAGSEGSTSCVITNEDGWYKRGCGTELNRPKFALMNPELTCTLPPYQTACGIVDMMAHVFERYFTNEEGVDLTDNDHGVRIFLKLFDDRSAVFLLNRSVDGHLLLSCLLEGLIYHFHDGGYFRDKPCEDHQLLSCAEYVVLDDILERIQLRCIDELRLVAVVCDQESSGQLLQSQEPCQYGCGRDLVSVR